MQSSHTLVTDVAFDDPTIIGSGGIVPMLGLASACGIEELVDQRLTVPTDKGAHAGAKVLAVLAGMVMDGDSIDDMAVLRHGAMGRVLDRPYAPSTLGSFLRMFSLGNVRQLNAVATHVVTTLAANTPVLDDIAGPVFVDVDDTIVAVHGHRKQAVGFGYSGVRGLNALIGTISGAHSAPMIGGQQLRRGKTNSSRGAYQFVAEMIGKTQALREGRAAGILLRADSAFYTHNAVSAAVNAGADVSVTMKMDNKVARTIAGIDEDAWTSITYSDPVFDEQSGTWVHQAAIAAVPYTAFTSAARPHSDHIAGRMIVRRVPKYTDKDQPGLFTDWRYRAIFTTVTDTDPVAAEKTHCRHAIIEQVHADLKGSALRHLPSGIFTANAAWLICAAIAFNLTRAAGTLTGSPALAVATTATIRRKLITVPARITSSARRHTAHMPLRWPWQHEWLTFFEAVNHRKYAV